MQVCGLWKRQKGKQELDVDRNLTCIF